MDDPKTVRKLEKDLEEAIAEAMRDLGLKKLPVLPSQHTMEMMAKAVAGDRQPSFRRPCRCAYTRLTPPLCPRLACPRSAWQPDSLPLAC